MSKIRLLLADKCEIFREGLVKLLETEPDVEVVCSCRTGNEAIDGAMKHQPDVVLIDTELSECNCFEAIQCIHEGLPNTNVIALARSEASGDFYSVLRGGARGYLSRDVTVESLIKAIILAAQGDVIISPPMAARVVAEFSSLERHEGAAKTWDATLLSKRERAVLTLVAQGLTNKEIASTLFISEHTVKVHLRNIMGKLQAHTRQQAVALATREDLLSESIRN